MNENIPLCERQNCKTRKGSITLISKSFEADVSSQNSIYSPHREGITTDSSRASWRDHEFVAALGRTRDREKHLDGMTGVASIVLFLPTGTSPQPNCSSASLYNGDTNSSPAVRDPGDKCYNRHLIATFHGSNSSDDQTEKAYTPKA